MNNTSTITQISSFLFYYCLQIAISHYLSPSPVATCFIYVAFLLLLPYHSANVANSLLVAFFAGLLVDFWYKSIGIHAFASVLMIYARALFLAILLPRTAKYETGIRPSLANLGWPLFPLLAFVLIVIHHMAVFLLDTGNPRLTLWALHKTSLSVLFTYSAVLITQAFFQLINRG